MSSTLLCLTKYCIHTYPNDLLFSFRISTCSSRIMLRLRSTSVIIVFLVRKTFKWTPPAMLYLSPFLSNKYINWPHRNFWNFCICHPILMRFVPFDPLWKMQKRLLLAFSCIFYGIFLKRGSKGPKNGNGYGKILFVFGFWWFFFYWIPLSRCFQSYFNRILLSLPFF